MRLDDILHVLRASGAQPSHEAPLLRHWLGSQPLDPAAPRIVNRLPRVLRETWPAVWDDIGRAARLRSQHPAADGSVRLLVELADGQTVESVLLPRGGLCVSTQVGCAVGCVFCMTGRDGLLRQLGAAEMAGQVALARRLRAVSKVVFMGMGEPAHNLDAVIEAIELLGTLGGIAHKKLVFSTVGDHRVFERLPRARVQPALALSLHTTDAAKRARLLPRAPQIDPAELIALAETYARATGYPIQYQWTLLAGINDGADEVARAAELLRGKYAVLNLIPYNSVDGLDFTRPSWEHAAAIARTLHQQGVLTKLRHSAGQDVDGGCGQLRARSQADATRPSATPAQRTSRVITLQRAPLAST
jgi:23S rRNA (adenine2503-C2)-methyltransferase